jgi:hypothetical protein
VNTGKVSVSDCVRDKLIISQGGNPVDLSGEAGDQDGIQVILQYLLLIIPS